MVLAIAEVVVAPRKSPESAQIGERLRVVWGRTGITARDVASGMGLTSPEGFRQYLKGNIRNWPAAVPRLARGLRMDPVVLAEQLEVPFDPRLLALESKVYQALGPERIHLVDKIFEVVVELPPDLQDKALEMMRVSVLGIRADLRSS